MNVGKSFCRFWKIIKKDICASVLRNLLLLTLYINYVRRQSGHKKLHPDTEHWGYLWFRLCLYVPQQLKIWHFRAVNERVRMFNDSRCHMYAKTKM